MEQVSFCIDVHDLDQRLSKLTGDYSAVFVLCDTNTAIHCLPLLQSIKDATIITVQDGEQHKTLKTCEQIWTRLTEQHADRRALLINLGGGVVTDMGGYAAACYKRGIDFIHIPTTLLAMVDAAVGGKTGVDLNGFKNQIGLFCYAKHVLICSEFLKTLDPRNIKAGYAEVVKHYLIADADLFTKMDGRISIELIQRAVQIKSTIVQQDPTEKGIRKILNFGHTIGHAIETYYLNEREYLLHGEAVAIGMTIETILAKNMGILAEGESAIITSVLSKYFDLQVIDTQAVNDIVLLMLQDKKNDSGIIKMALIDRIGHCRYDVDASEQDVKTAIADYNKLIGA